MSITDLYFKHAAVPLADVDAFLAYAQNSRYADVAESYRRSGADTREQLMAAALSGNDPRLLAALAAEVTDLDALSNWFARNGVDHGVVVALRKNNPSVALRLLEQNDDDDLRVSLLRAGVASQLRVSSRALKALSKWTRERWPVGTLFDSDGVITEDGRKLERIAAEGDLVKIIGQHADWLTLLRLVALTSGSNQEWMWIARNLVKRTRLTQAETTEIGHLVKDLDRFEWARSNAAMRVYEMLQQRSPRPIAALTQVTSSIVATQVTDLGETPEDAAAACANDIISSPNVTEALTAACQKAAGMTPEMRRTFWSKVRGTIATADMSEQRTAEILTEMTHHHGVELVPLWATLHGRFTTERLAGC